ncbi:Vacuolar protein sorting-associated protein atg6 [Smittium mucronatum]|uniref:Vacuolar protein sorting-associated protein atg6 n=1 Tax=Smittium mucronatum TaxID=133383 RepID=A0A1R0GXM0_9FUNG|nr:Vacuolar protein sorting-associated protein atg6 [Smittium mucronatum]
MPQIEPYSKLMELWSKLSPEYSEIFSKYMPRLKFLDQNRSKEEDSKERKFPSPLLSTNEIVQILEINNKSDSILLNSKTIPISNFSELANEEPRDKIHHSYSKSIQDKFSGIHTSLKNSYKLKQKPSPMTPYRNITLNTNLKDSVSDSFVILEDPTNAKHINFPKNTNSDEKKLSKSLDSSHIVNHVENRNTLAHGDVSSHKETVGINTNEKKTSTQSKSTIPDNKGSLLQDTERSELVLTNRLFLDLESKSMIDHPLCTSCTEKFLTLIKKKIECLSEEYENVLELFESFSRDVDIERGKDHDFLVNSNTYKADIDSSARGYGNSSIDSLEEESRLLAIEYERLSEIDRSYDLDISSLCDQISLLDAEGDSLDSQINSLMQERNELSTKLDSLTNEIELLQSMYSKQSNLLFSLQQRNVYNDLFTIKIFSANDQISPSFFSSFSHSQNSDYPSSGGYNSGLPLIGMINGFRLGRINTGSLLSIQGFSESISSVNPLKSGEISWNEINAGWGQCLLLLVTVARRLNFEYPEYQLIPMGSYSKIIKQPSTSGGERTSYEL